MVKYIKGVYFSLSRNHKNLYTYVPFKSGKILRYYKKKNIGEFGMTHLSCKGQHIGVWLIVGFVLTIFNEDCDITTKLLRQKALYLSNIQVLKHRLYIIRVLDKLIIQCYIII